MSWLVSAHSSHVRYQALAINAAACRALDKHSADGPVFDVEQLDLKQQVATSNGQFPNTQAMSWLVSATSATNFPGIQHAQTMMK